MKNTDEKEKEQAEYRKRKLLEMFLWLLILGSFLLIILQALGIINILKIESRWFIFLISTVGICLIGSVAYQVVQNYRLREKIKNLMQQRMQYSPITIATGENSEEVEQKETQQDQLWKEQVRFNAVIEERQRLARELHDAVSQQLFAISMTATAVGRTIEHDWQKARRQVQLIEEMASVAQSEMRALLLHLRPTHLNGKSLGEALTLLVNELQKKIPMNIGLDVDTTIVMREESEDHLFRIAQEALSNTLRHAKANQMQLKLYRQEETIYLVIQDDGIGFDMKNRKQSSYGLLTMEERIIELGGKFRIISEPGEGTAIYIQVPYEPPLIGNFT